jgi:hypothetical protein
MTKTVKITSDFLKSIRACGEVRKKFRKLFPNGAYVTKETLELAFDNDISAEYLIHMGGISDADIVKYNRSIKALFDVYDAKPEVIAARAREIRQYVSLNKKLKLGQIDTSGYRPACQAAYDEYQKATASAHKWFDRRKQTILLRALTPKFGDPRAAKLVKKAVKPCKKS